uniref:Vacuolar protein sorting-associated protein 51 homolog n=1 Tax=Macrostomum lignano TaxID=282301 RepID=A0A1I8GAN4_9PLAT
MDEIITNRTLSFWKAISSQVSIVSNACALEFGAAATADSADFTSPTAADPTAAGSSTRRARVLTALERLVYFLTDDKLAANLELGNSNYRIVENRDDEAFDGAEEAGQFEHSAQPAASQVAKEVKSACHVLKSPSLLESQSERLAAYRRVKRALEKVAEFAEKPFTERLQTLHVQLADLLSQLRHPARVNSALARLQLLRRLLPQLNSALQSAVMQPASSTAGTAKRELLARALELVDGIEAALMASSQAGTAAAASTAGSLAGGGIFVESGHFVLNVDELIFCLNEANRHFLRPSKLERLANSFLRHVTAVCDLLPADEAGATQAAAREFDELKDSLLMLLNSSEAADDASAMSDFNGLCDSLAEQCKLIEAGVNEALVGLLVHAFNDAAVPLERLCLQLMQRPGEPNRQSSAAGSAAPYSDLSSTWLSSLYADFEEKFATMARVVKFASASCDNPKDIKEIANGMRDCERLHSEISAAISPLAAGRWSWGLQQQQQQQPEFLADLRTSWSRAVTHLTCVLDRV